MITRKYVILSLLLSFSITVLFSIIFIHYFCHFGLDTDTLKNTLYYFFSTDAQVLAAMLGIGLAAYYATVTNLKATIETVYMEELYRSLLTDKTLNISAYFGIISIVLSLISLIFINMLQPLIIFMISLVILTFFCGISSIVMLLSFVLFGLKSFFNPNNYLNTIYNELITEGGDNEPNQP